MIAFILVIGGIWWIARWVVEDNEGKKGKGTASHEQKVDDVAGCLIIGGVILLVFLVDCT